MNADMFQPVDTQEKGVIGEHVYAHIVATSQDGIRDYELGFPMSASRKFDRALEQWSCLPTADRATRTCRMIKFGLLANRCRAVLRGDNSTIAHAYELVDFLSNIIPEQPPEEIRAPVIIALLDSAAILSKHGSLRQQYLCLLMALTFGSPADNVQAALIEVRKAVADFVENELEAWHGAGIFVRIPAGEAGEKEVMEDCPICYESEQPQDVIQLGCKHVFHEACLVMWMEQASKTCPACRADMFGLAGPPVFATVVRHR
ncbi:hypothetical protein CAC42_6698 [Sphaceloma murrayae]|uniref:RING-type domain-containing protein n=1 Tax=Sphaceloma murrayae TaxID=2082308 RepID=A0A2K1QG95_9PEZI|nr:hypothetical protein CAC42_6698 [Sphaceloma murrayae]